MESLYASIATGVMTLIGTVITCLATAKRTEQNMRINQAVFDTRIEELTREVREHNTLATRVPVVEEQVRSLEHRMNNVEKKRKGSVEK